MKERHMHHDHRVRHHHPEPDGSLVSLFDRCGHVFAHRVGGSHRGQGNVLRIIAEHDSVTQKELAELLKIQPASMSETIMKLERKGLIEREKDENDRRVVRVKISEEGRSILESMEKERSDPFEALEPAEQQQLQQLLEKLLSDWEIRGGEERGHRRGGRGRNEREMPPREDEND